MLADAPAIECRPHTAPIGYHWFHPDVSLNFQCNRWLQWIGPSAAGEITTAAKAGHTYPEWINAFLDLAGRARSEQRKLAAAYYDRAAEFFMRPDDPRKAPARSRFLQGMRAVYGLDDRLDRVRFDDGSLPAYDLMPEGVVLGTVVAFGGFDSYVEEFLPMLAAIVQSGYRVVAFDGPGQGSALQMGLPMTPEWERPVSAVLDHYGLDEVTLIGISLGGGLAIRAAAFEPRVRRLVADDVLDDFLECIGRQTAPGATPLLRLLLAAHARPVINGIGAATAARKAVAEWGVQQGMHITGTRSPYEFLRAARSLTTRSVSGRVTADVLLLAAAEDHYVPAHQLHRQAKALTHARSVTTRVFTAAEQAQNHCHVGNVGASVRVMLGWLDSLVPA